MPERPATDGSGARLEAAWRQHSADVLAYAARRASTPEDAADVLAETYLVAWRRIADLPDEPDTRPWLFGVARHALANQRRGEQRRTALAESLIQQAAATVVVHQRPPGDDPAARSLARALDGLSESDRELVLLAGWEGLTPAEIATVLACPAATVRVRLHRARRRLRTLLDAELDAGELDAHRSPVGEPAGKRAPRQAPSPAPTTPSPTQTPVALPRTPVLEVPR